MNDAKRRTTIAAERVLRTTSSPTRAREILAAQGIELTINAVAMIKKKMTDAPSAYTPADEYLPWLLARQDRGKFDAQMLRRLARRMKGGKPLTLRENTALDAWLKRLTDADEVIDYDRDNFVETPEGELVRRPFFAVPRRYRRNKWGELTDPVDPPWIKDPRFNDDGSAKEWTDR